MIRQPGTMLQRKANGWQPGLFRVTSEERLSGVADSGRTGPICLWKVADSQPCRFSCVAVPEPDDQISRSARLGGHFDSALRLRTNGRRISGSVPHRWYIGVRRRRSLGKTSPASKTLHSAFAVALFHPISSPVPSHLPRDCASKASQKKYRRFERSLPHHPPSCCSITARSRLGSKGTETG
jgi:hypothetical protein